MEYSLKQSALGHTEFLSSLMDCLGVCSLNPIELIAKVKAIFLRKLLLFSIIADFNSVIYF